MSQKVIVRPCLECLKLILQAGLRGQDQNGSPCELRFAAQDTGQFIAADIGHHHIGNNCIGFRRPCQRNALISVRCKFQLRAERRQCAGHKVMIDRFVIDY